ncbi:MAG: hypothetical protein HY907_21285 [Deltaproteobacteria bacterium]|nr:hypothetical protein [Deltaproteobacteria bacterium]
MRFLPAVLVAVLATSSMADEPSPAPAAGPGSTDQEPMAPPPPGPAVTSVEPIVPSPSEPTTDDRQPTTPLAPELGTFGIGVLLGRPLGATAKVFLAPAHALQFGLGYDLVLLDAATVTMDYVWHPTSIFGNSVFEFTWHVGIGASLGVWPAGSEYDCSGGDPMTGGVPSECSTAWVQPGARVPLGIEMIFREVPLELFAEFAPGVIAYPEVGFLGQGGFGARWYL